MTTASLTADDFASLLAPYAAGGRVALAVSGGPDSMALAWGASQVLTAPLALIVDHGLRPESADEAALVKTRLEAMGIEALVLRWAHEPVTSRIHVAARKARYDLLLKACKAQGIGTLLLAHHRDDQAETILMRLAKGSGLDGLAGMAREAEMDGVRLVRPLLGLSKSQLVATCGAQGVAFVTDPSNESEKYARGRLRRVQDLLGEEGLTPERLIDLGERATEAAQAIDFYAKLFLRAQASVTPGGAVRIEREGLGALPQAVQLKALALCLMTTHPTPYPPERASLLGLLAGLARTEEGRTLHGCEIRLGESHIHISREPAAIRDRQSLQPGQTVVWDQRWRVTLTESEPAGLTVQALGLQTHEVLDRLALGLRQKVPQGRVRAALPSLWRDGVLVLIPSFFEENQGPAYASPLTPLWR